MFHSVWNQVHQVVTCGYRSDTNETQEVDQHHSQRASGSGGPPGGGNSKRGIQKMFSSAGENPVTMYNIHFFSIQYRVHHLKNNNSKRL